MTRQETLDRIIMAKNNSIMAIDYLVNAMNLEHSVERKQLIDYARDSLQRALDEIEPLQDQWKQQ
jgi:hypothetical protein